MVRKWQYTFPARLPCKIVHTIYLSSAFNAFKLTIRKHWLGIVSVASSVLFATNHAQKVSQNFPQSSQFLSLPCVHRHFYVTHVFWPIFCLTVCLKADCQKFSRKKVARPQLFCHGVFVCPGLVCTNLNGSEFKFPSFVCPAVWLESIKNSSEKFMHWLMLLRLYACSLDGFAQVKSFAQS